MFPAMVLCARRLPFLERVPASPVPRLRRYYEAATTSRVVRPSAYGFASGFRLGSTLFVSAYALPAMFEPIAGPGALVTRGSYSRVFPNGRARDLSGSLATPPAPLPCSKTPAEPTNSGLGGLADAAPAPNTAKASALP